MNKNTRLSSTFRGLVALSALGLSIGLIPSLSAGIISIGPGSTFAGTGVDTAGTRLNIDEAGASLLAGAYGVTSFDYRATANDGDLQPFLAKLVGTNSYEVLWAGDRFDADAGSQSVAFAPSTLSSQFTLAADADVYAGFIQWGQIVYFANTSQANGTDHDNTFSVSHAEVSPLTAGDTITDFSHPSLPRRYAYDISLTAVPEPSALIGALTALSLSGLFLRRRR